MKPEEFVYNEVVRGCRDAGLSEYASTTQANEAVTAFRRNQFSKKVSNLIADQVVIAKKTNKKEKKG